MTTQDNLTEEELKALRASKNESEWNKACDAVKRARGGFYPSSWFQEMMLSGEMSRITAKFK